MKRQIHIPQDICYEALQVAIHDGFPEVIRILKSFRDGTADVSTREASHILEFAKFLRQRASLHYPYWDDSQLPHSTEHEDNFHEVNMGLHEKLISHIGDPGPVE
jgi:hypothetical protein